MKRVITYAKHFALAACLTQLPTLFAADCVPTGTTGDLVPFTLVTLKNNQVASYATGTLTLNNNNIPYSLEQGRSLSATQIPQLLSDHVTSYDPGCTGLCLNQTQQPFNAFEPDQLGVSVSESTNFLTIGGSPGPTITITLTLESKGNEKLSFAGTCASTGELYGTFESNSFAVVAFGTPEPPQPPPQ